MIVEDLLQGSPGEMYNGVPESNALTEVGSLREAALRDFRFDWASGSAALLLDLRVSFYTRGNVAVVVFRDVVNCAVTEVQRSHNSWLADLIMRSTPSVQNALFSFEVGCLSGMNITVVSRSAEFFVGNTEGLPEAQPDFTEATQSEIDAGMPGWNKDFWPLYATFVNA